MLNILAEEGVINDAIRIIFAAINNGIYTLIAITYNLIEDLAKISILSYGDMEKFASRIYALLGLFMLFKVSFSIITYILDPNKMTDSSTGFSAIIKNTVITLVLILTVPMAFNLLYEAQDAILSENVLPKLILGTDSDMSQKGSANMDFKDLEIQFSPNYCDKPVVATDNGQFISLMILRPFIQPNPEFDKSTFEGRGNDIKERYCTPWSWAKDNGKTTKQIRGIGYFYKYGENLDYEFATVNTYLGDEDVYNSADGTNLGWADYDLEFNFFIAMLVGIAVELIMIGIAMDVALRSVKLAFLQLISPIPIVSYIDPKKGKDGMFKNWYTEVFKTWASLFIRLIAVFFGVYMIQQLNGSLYIVSGTADDIKSDYFWIMVFLIIGILMFMKQLPNLLESLIPGMKGAGSFTLNPFKKVTNEAVGGKLLAGAGVAAGAMGIAAGGGAIANALAADKGNKMRSFGKGLFTGSYYGAKTGFQRGMNGKFNFGRAGYDAIKENSKFRNKTDDLADAGVRGPFKLARQAIRDEYTDVIGKRGASGTTSLIKDQVHELERNLANAQRDEAAASHAMEMMRSKDDGYKAGMYADAFKSRTERGADGKLYDIKENGNNYSEWLERKIGRSYNDLKADYADQAKTNLMFDDKFLHMNVEEQQRALEKEQRRLVSENYGADYLTEEEYNTYNSLYEARNAADAAGQKYQKEINNKQKLYEKVKKQGG